MHALILAPILLVLAAPPPAPSTKSFPKLSRNEAMFTLTVPESGFWRFCLAGTKAKDGQFLFEAVVQRGDKQLRVDWTQGTPPGKTEVNECAIQKKDEIPLKAGELVTVRSRVETPGPLKLTLTASKL